MELSSFRGYRKKVRINFGTEFTIIDGRNGVGKSTIFDAVEFALTGTIDKYQGAKADRETVDDYIWWRGEDLSLDDRYVEIGFLNDGVETVVRRTSTQPGMASNLEAVSVMLCDPQAMPELALKQLCTSSILRDELIAALSLDLRETDRYSLLSSAIGATGSDKWIESARKAHSLSKEELDKVETFARAASDEFTVATVKLDQARAEVLNDKEIKVASNSLSQLLNVRADTEELIQIARAELVRIAERTKALSSVESSMLQIAGIAKSIESLTTENSQTKLQSDAVSAERQRVETELGDFGPSADMDDYAARLSELADLGEAIGCNDDQCPLCKSNVSTLQFEVGIKQLREAAQKLSRDAAATANLRREIAALLAKQRALVQKSSDLESELLQAQSDATELQRMANELFGSRPVSRESVANERVALTTRQSLIEQYLPLIDNAGRNSLLLAAEKKRDEAREESVRAERALAAARLTETRCKSLFDNVRRAAGDALNVRLERILPLITELYSRLRPHPVFGEIDYKMRGELRRNLSFRVGDNVNPQFVFSSGQRRATGLAFLIAVNLSLAWSRWSTIMLDDPVQHIDDFRSIHLAELLAQLVIERRQLICAVEDAALADLLRRRLPVSNENSGMRVTLGINDTGDIDVLASERVAQLPVGIFDTSDFHRSTG